MEKFGDTRFVFPTFLDKIKKGIGIYYAKPAANSKTPIFFSFHALTHPQSSEWAFLSSLSNGTTAFPFRFWPLMLPFFLHCQQTFTGLFLLKVYPPLH